MKCPRKSLHSAYEKGKKYASQKTPTQQSWPLAPSRHSATQDLRTQTTEHNGSTKEAGEELKNKSLLVQLQKDIKQD